MSERVPSYSLIRSLRSFDDNEFTCPGRLILIDCSSLFDHPGLFVERGGSLGQ